MSDISHNDTWKVEQTGIDLVPETERTGNAKELFWIWSAANIGILGVVYGAIVVGFGLSFVQSILATLVGVASFILVGYTSLAGQMGRTSTLTLSRVIFGIKGNVLPTVFSWINLMGWEAVNVITGTLTLSALLQTIGMPNSGLLTSMCLLLFAGLTIGVSLLGQSMVVLVQSWCTKVFGTMTLIVVGYILLHTDWAKIFALPSGNWLTGFLPAVSVIAAGTGISWAIAGADYSRYQASHVKKASLFSAVVGGACLPLVILMFAGILLSAQLPDLASAENPILLIGSVLPTWMAVPYLITAIAGIVTIAVLSLYSASLNLLTIGVKVKQSVAVSLDAIIMLAVAIYVLFVSRDFLTPFISFLIFCGVFLAAWEAIFILDYWLVRRQQGYHATALFGTQNGLRLVPLGCWLLGSIIGLLVTKTGFIDGPWAKGVFADSSLGLFVSFAVSLLSYGLYLLTTTKGRVSACQS